MIRDLWLVFLGVAVGWVFFAPSTMEVQAGASYDERKWERIQRNREVRIANERRYEVCARKCMEGCK